MRRIHLLVGGALVLTSAWAVAQDAPESLLPAGFDKPARPSREPAREPSRAAAPQAPSAQSSASPTIQPLPVPGGAAPVPDGKVALPRNLPSLEALEAMSPDELDEAFALRSKDDIPPAARRAMKRVGVIDEGEGGLPSWNLRLQDPSLVQAAIAGNSGQLLSRWGHILLRRALASRLDAPEGMNPADFAALRAALLVRMGEGTTARGLVQDIDTANYTPGLTQAALDAYVATFDFTGICPVISLQGAARKDKPWHVLQAMCDGFAGEGSRSMAALDRLTYYGAMPRIDMLLAQKYAGTAGKARRAVTIEWNGVKDMTPWRFAMTSAVGLKPPAELMKDAAPGYAFMAATAPMLPLSARASAADVAGCRGVLSAAAMVDLYGQLYDEDNSTSEWTGRAGKLRDAYVAERAADRLAALKELWGDRSDPARTCSREVLTAYAAARLPVDAGWASDAPQLIAAMLLAGLDANAMRWAPVVEKGSEGWALLALANPAAAAADSGAVDDFHGNDDSAELRKSAFLVAGLAGLGRLSPDAATGLAQKYGFRMDYQSRWTRAIDKAAELNNRELVALLAGLGMQGDSWQRMTARNLYHIVSALNRVGLSAEARLIAAEAVARA